MLLFLEFPTSPFSKGGSEMEMMCFPIPASISSSPSSGVWLTVREPQRLDSTPERSTNGFVCRSSLWTYANCNDEGELDNAFATWQEGDNVRRSEACS